MLYYIKFTNIEICLKYFTQIIIINIYLKCIIIIPVMDLVNTDRIDYCSIFSKGVTTNKHVST
jgi:hypothetical protein